MAEDAKNGDGGGDVEMGDKKPPPPTPTKPEGTGEGGDGEEGDGEEGGGTWASDDGEKKDGDVLSGEGLDLDLGNISKVGEPLNIIDERRIDKIQALVMQQQMMEEENTVPWPHCTFALLCLFSYITLMNEFTPKMKHMAGTKVPACGKSEAANPCGTPIYGINQLSGGLSTNVLWYMFGIENPIFFAVYMLLFIPISCSLEWDNRAFRYGVKMICWWGFAALLKLIRKQASVGPLILIGEMGVALSIARAVKQYIRMHPDESEEFGINPDAAMAGVSSYGQEVADTEKTVLRIHTEFVSSQFLSLPN